VNGEFVREVAFEFAVVDLPGAQKRLPLFILGSVSEMEPVFTSLRD